ncbi:uncharacterized protein LOC107728774 [Sinocyclocheilus rhinocerous]|uniref:uncharacterized protein LOC107728774 n=1 Tax=Sinocyclocheilus rhinocerous TaxID=307959 RepID=UPI0007BA17F2|nr:PREDICTED: uncharacterized protein LOC107728774 [Sinocyclocheilus rhinocerous]
MPAVLAAGLGPVYLGRFWGVIHPMSMQMSCIMYISRLWIFFGALVSSNALDRWNTRCIGVTVNASLKSEVFLPCHFNISHYNGTLTVNWSHYPTNNRLVTIMTDGKIIFGSPSEGRVNVFPLLSKHGNFSILIHDLQSSDIDTYLCQLNSECWRVKIIERSPYRISEPNPWFYFAAGAGLFILLFIAFSLLSKFCGKCVNTSSKSNPVNELQSEGSNSPQETQNIEHRNKNKRGISEPNPWFYFAAGAGLFILLFIAFSLLSKFCGKCVNTSSKSNPVNELQSEGVRRGPTTVYENDIHAPNQSSAVQLGQHPQRAFRAVPEPTRSHPSDAKPYYVNQAELSIPVNAGKKRKKLKNYQFKNPIYGD